MGLRCGHRMHPLYLFECVAAPQVLRQEPVPRSDFVQQLDLEQEDEQQPESGEAEHGAHQGKGCWDHMPTLHGRLPCRQSSCVHLAGWPSMQHHCLKVAECLLAASTTVPRNSAVATAACSGTASRCKAGPEVAQPSTHCPFQKALVQWRTTCGVQPFASCSHRAARFTALIVLACRG